MGSEEEPHTKLTLTQCVVGGVIGFGVLSALLCLMIGAGPGFWLLMTAFLTVVYTLYYLYRTRNG